MNLQQYAEGIPDHLILGYIGWYTLYDPAISPTKLADVANVAGIDKRHIPKKPRLGDVFKRACRNAPQNKLPIPNTDTFANTLVRKVTSANEEIEQHLVIEVVDKTGKRLDFHSAAKLRFNRLSNSLFVDSLVIPVYLDVIRDQGMTTFKREFEHARTTIEPQVIRLMIREHLKDMGAITVRDRGSVYFLPGKEKELIEGMEYMFAEFGNESQFHVIPLPDTSKQREMVQAAFDSNVHERAETLIEKVNGMLSKDKVGDKEWEKFHRTYRQLKQQRDEYAELLDQNAIRADTEMTVLDTKVQQLLLGGIA